MTAILKVTVAELTTDWVEQIKKEYSNAEIEVHIKTLQQEAMSDVEFWQLINLLNWEVEDDAAVIEPTVAALSQRSIAKIYAFQELLASKLYQLDTPQHAQMIGEDAYDEGEYFSVDQFLYARACVVANGQSVYEKVLNNPAAMPKDMIFEALLRIASDAYERKTGRQFYYLTNVSYETYSNESAWSKKG